MTPSFYTVDNGLAFYVIESLQEYMSKIYMSGDLIINCVGSSTNDSQFNWIILFLVDNTHFEHLKWIW